MTVTILVVTSAHACYFDQVYPWLTSVSIVFIFTLLCDASIAAILGSELMSVVYEGNAHESRVSVT